MSRQSSSRTQQTLVFLGSPGTVTEAILTVEALQLGELYVFTKNGDLRFDLRLRTNIDEQHLISGHLQPQVPFVVLTIEKISRGPNAGTYVRILSVDGIVDGWLTPSSTTNGYGDALRGFERISLNI